MKEYISFSCTPSIFSHFYISLHLNSTAVIPHFLVSYWHLIQSHSVMFDCLWQLSLLEEYVSHVYTKSTCVELKLFRKRQQIHTSWQVTASNCFVYTPVWLVSRHERVHALHKSVNQFRRHDFSHIIRKIPQTEIFYRSNEGEFVLATCYSDLLLKVRRFDKETRYSRIDLRLIWILQ